MKKLTFVFLAVALLATAAMAAPASRALIRPDAPFDRVAHFQKMFTLQGELRAEAVGLASTVPIDVKVTAEERQAVRDYNVHAGKIRAGVVKELRIPMEFAAERITTGEQLHDAFGATRGAADGTFVWDGVIRSPEATAISVHFTDVNLPAGTGLYVFTDEGMAFGPYTGRGPNRTGDFWSNAVVGSEIFIQLRAQTDRLPRFTIAGVGHMTPEFVIAKSLLPEMSTMATTPCEVNGAHAPCVVDAACTSLDGSEVAVAKDAVAQMLFVSGAYYYLCSGGLVADAAASRTPYFITANHCISRASEASSLQTYFFYEATTCGGCPTKGSASTTGATIVSTNKSSDYTLLELSGAAPSGAAFLGWNSTAIANTDGVALYRISHPGGAPQSYSEHVVDTKKGVCRSWPRGPWIYSRDVFGATEGGSSGSPVVNAQGQLVGQLSGGCGTNVNDECDSASNATVDGAFAAYYSTVAQWLDAGGGGPTCVDNDKDGYCANIAPLDCNDNNAAIYPGAPDGGKAGKDGIDNDCDGKIDK